MALGDGKLADAGQAVHLSGILVAEQGGSFAVAQGEFPVGVLVIFINIILEGTGHRPERKNLFVGFFITEDKHSVFIVIPMSGNLI